MRFIIILGLVFPTFSADITNQACSIKLPVNDPKTDILLNHLKFKEPKPTPNRGNAITFQCETGFLAEEITGKSVTVVCEKGKYNGTYKYEDLLCKSDFHKSVKVKKLKWDNLNSGVFKCNDSGWGVYEVARKLKCYQKALYRVCLDLNVMRPKFVYRLASPEKIEPKHHYREDVWGFDCYGKTTEDRIQLSQGYVQRNQQRTITKAFPNKYSQGKQFPYYFNRGHLVAFTDFSDPEDSKATVLYINAAPQWDILNKHSWSIVEREVRSLMKNDPANWEIYTGTFGRIQSPKIGDLFLVPVSNKNGKFVPGKLPVPMVFWKFAHNLVDKSKSRVYVGVNNPEFRKVHDVKPEYLLCKPSCGIKGDENFGFYYQCPVAEFLNRLKTEKIVVENIKY